MLRSHASGGPCGGVGEVLISGGGQAPLRDAPPAGMLDQPRVPENSTLPGAPQGRQHLPLFQPPMESLGVLVHEVGRLVKGIKRQIVSGSQAVSDLAVDHQLPFERTVLTHQLFRRRYLGHDRPRWSRALLPGLRNAAGPDLGVLIALAALTAVAALLAGCAAGRQLAHKTVVVRCGYATHTVSATGALSGVAADGALAVVPFAEADAAALRPGQPVSVIVDAVSGAPRPGRLLAIAPSAATISGVTKYYATVTVADRDAACLHVMCWLCRTPR
ncbi:MAG: HlyD family secretion protein [Pseudonocardiales bacterium]|nr:HlyD family secretion protein [Pseudonocardiales bacterium]